MNGNDQELNGRGLSEGIISTPEQGTNQADCRLMSMFGLNRFANYLLHAGVCRIVWTS